MTTTTPVLKETTSVWAKEQGATASKPLPADPGTAPPPSLPDLAVLTDDALTALVEQGQAEVLRRKQRKETDFLSLVAETARTLGLSPTRVAAAIASKSPRARASGANDGRAVVAPKYRDPADPAKTWSGRGKAPTWLTFGDEVDSETGKPVPLRKFWIAEQT